MRGGAARDDPVWRRRTEWVRRPDRPQPVSHLACLDQEQQRKGRKKKKNGRIESGSRKGEALPLDLFRRAEVAVVIVRGVDFELLCLQDPKRAVASTSARLRCQIDELKSPPSKAKSAAMTHARARTGRVVSTE